MRINFRQGIVGHQTSGNVQDFLGVNPSGNIDLKADNRPTTVTIAHAQTDYLFTENNTVTDAWLGPFSALNDYWLYWNFDQLTFDRTFGYTTLEPVAQDAEPGNGNAAVVDIIPGGMPTIGAITVEGHYILPVNRQFAITGSDNNDGTYTIAQVNYDDLRGETTLTVTETVDAPGAELGEATLDIDAYGNPLLINGRHWFDTASKRHYVRNDGVWTEVLRVFAAHVRNGTTIVPQSITHGTYAGTQIGDTRSVRAGRVIYDEASNVIRRDNKTFFTTEDQFFANGARVDAIRLESNVARGQFMGPGAAISPFSVVAWERTGEGGRVRVADYDDIGRTVLGMLTEPLHLGEVGAIVLQGVVTNVNWGWTTGPDAVPVGTELFVENGLLVPYDPHVQGNRAAPEIVGVNPGNDETQYFEVAGGYSPGRGQLINIDGNSANNDGAYRVVSSEFITASNRTRILVEEIIIDGVSGGKMYLTVGNFPIGQVPVARVLDNDTVIFDQGLGGKGDQGPAGSIENLPLSSTVQLGGTYLTLDAVDPELPLVVGDNDPRLVDARLPLYHTHPAVDIGFAPTPTLSSLTVQEALEEVDAAKLNLTGGTLTGYLTLHADPLNPLHAATKYYVDSLVSGLVWLEPICTLNMIDDTLIVPPVAPIPGDSYLLPPGAIGAWGAFDAGDVVSWDGFGWVDRGPLTAMGLDGARVGIAMNSTTVPGGSYAGRKNQIAEYDVSGALTGFEVPTLNNAVYVCGDSDLYAYNQFAFSGTKWVLFGGGSSVGPDGTTTTQIGNVLSVIQFDDGGIIDARYWQGLEPSDLNTLYAATNHFHTASEITFSSYTSPVPGLGNVIAPNVQEAIQEAYDEKAALQPSYANVAALPDPTTYDGMLAHATETHEHYVAQDGEWRKLGVYPLQIPYDISFFLAGQMLFMNAITGSFLATREIGIQAGAPGSLARCKTAPQIDVTYQLITDDGTATTPIGDITFLANNRTGNINFPAGVTLQPGTEIQLITPAVLEGFIQDVSITLVGCAGAPECSQPVPNPLQTLWTPYDHAVGSDLVWNGNGWYYDGDYGGCTACSRALVPVGGWEAGYRPANIQITVELEGDPDWGSEYIEFLDTNGNNIIGAPTDVTVGGANTYVLNYPLDFGNGFDLDYLGLFLGECFYAAGCANTDRPWTITDITLSGTWMPI